MSGGAHVPSDTLIQIPSQPVFCQDNDRIVQFHETCQPMLRTWPGTRAHHPDKGSPVTCSEDFSCEGTCACYLTIKFKSTCISCYDYDMFQQRMFTRSMLRFFSYFLCESRAPSRSIQAAFPRCGDLGAKGAKGQTSASNVVDYNRWHYPRRGLARTETKGRSNRWQRHVPDHGLSFNIGKQGPRQGPDKCLSDASSK